MSDHDSDFASVPELLSQLRDGRMIILVDDEDRENEGDLVVAAERISVEQIVQMNRLASGIITVPMPRPWLRRLHIDPMVQENAESMSTAFTVTVDASSGISTGSSAHDRATTIRKLADPTTSAEDFVRPGHINPLVVREGGVLKRPGHTEASHDLVRMAGLQPVAVLCEIMGDDGTMLRLPALRELAARLELPLGTIADVIRHRRRTEALVERVSSQELSSAFGPLQVHRYRSAVDAGRYTALGPCTRSSPRWCGSTPPPWWTTCSGCSPAGPRAIFSSPCTASPPREGCCSWWSGRPPWWALPTIATTGSGPRCWPSWGCDGCG